MATTARSGSSRDECAEPDWQPILPLRRPLASSIVAFWVLGFFVGVLWYVADDSGFWFMSGCLGCLIVSLPFVVGRREYELVSPWSLIVVAAYIGYGIRGLFLSLGINGIRSLEDLYFLGREPGYFLRPTAVFMLGLALLTAAYVVGGSDRPSRPIFGTRPHLDRGRVTLAVWACALVGLVGFLLYARSTGGLSFATLSAKRTVINGVNLEASYESHGEYRVINTFSFIAFWLQVAWYAYRRVPHGLFSVRGLWLVILFANAALLPVYASTRSDVVFLIISAVLIEYCLRGRGVRPRVLIAAVVVAVLSAAALSSLRNPDDPTQKVTLSPAVLVDTFVLTRTFADIPTAGQIIHAVPQRLPYTNGSTITAWLAAPIPRSLWPSKPIISSGPILGSVIYGNQHSGVPPGMIAESYWSFGLAGVLLIPVICGVAIRRIGDYWAPYARASPAAAILLSVAAVRPGIDLMINSTGFAPFTLLQTLVLLVPVLAFVSSDRPPRDAAGSDVSRTSRPTPTSRA